MDLKDTIRSFKAIMNGEGDDLPEGTLVASTQNQSPHTDMLH